MILHGDCLEKLRELEAASVDAIVTDPPYGLAFMGKRWDYDVPSVEVWRECLRVLKPGGHALIACGTRTQHRMVVNIEDAGFEIRDVVTWLYGQGFPKSLDISKAIDKAAGAEREVISSREEHNIKGSGENSRLQTSAGNRETVTVNVTAPATPAAKQWSGWGTALKPACEFWTLARKPLSEKNVAANVLKWGTGGLNIDGCRIEGQIPPTVSGGKAMNGGKFGDSQSERAARKVVVEGHALGRFPANLILDDESAVLLGDASRYFYCAKVSPSERNAGLGGMQAKEWKEQGFRDNESTHLSPRAGAGRTRANVNHHPTVKPVKLMRYLCRLVTPPGGLVLDPFAGSGSTGVAALLEGFRFVGIERESEYVAIAEKRLQAARFEAFVETEERAQPPEQASLFDEGTP